MNPLPVQHNLEARSPGPPTVSIPGVRGSSGSDSNRRCAGNPAQRAYPWLLAFSTLTAAGFCLLYITKPVIVTASSTPPTGQIRPAPKTNDENTVSHTAGLLPGNDRLPGDSPNPALNLTTTSAESRKTLPPPPVRSNLEETNLRIQHILTAEAPGGHMDRIDIDVPVLYQSRNLRWTPEECENARGLLTRLMDYQEKALQLRIEGVGLLDSWNQLVGKSLPTAELRADSPTLPGNQQDNADAPRAAGWITADSIQLTAPEK